MRSKSIVILGLAGILAFFACSSATEEKPTTQPTSAAAANANTVAIADGTELIPALPADANANFTSGGSLEAANRLSNRLENMRKAGDGPVGDARAIALKNARPAPDNSTFASYLSDDGYEIRIFKDHPQLSRVEKKITNDGKQTLKVFLRSGKVIELPGELINPLSTAPAAFILETAGVRTQPATPASSSQAGPPPTKKPTE